MSRRFIIRLHGEEAGVLTEEAAGGSEFRLSKGYLERVPRPVLGQKFEDDLHRVHRSRKRQELPDFFANLIPEGRLRDVLEETHDLAEGDDLALLELVGRDLPGAVEVVRLDEEGAAVLSPVAAGVPATHPDEDAVEALRFSLAGVQLKFSMLREEDNLTLPARSGQGEWIVKFDSPAFPRLPENEYSMLEWARSTGFEVPEAHLHEVDAVSGFPRRLAQQGTRVLAVRRYDREPEGVRIHQEDLAQAVGLPPAKKYDQITYEAMAILAARFIGNDAVTELVRRLAFVIASGNNDAHLKNWSLLYPDRIQAGWAPLYDQVSTVAWPQPGRELSLKLAGVKAFGAVDRAAFERFAQKVELPADQVLSTVEETLVEARRAWRESAAELPLPAEHTAALRQHWRTVPLLKPLSPLD